MSKTYFLPSSISLSDLGNIQQIKCNLIKIEEKWGSEAGWESLARPGRAEWFRISSLEDTYLSLYLK